MDNSSSSFSCPSRRRIATAVGEGSADTNAANSDQQRVEEPPAETQESFTQHEMTQTGNELTQMGLFDDDDDNDQHEDTNSRQPMIDPSTLPWGRLMPVGSCNNATSSANGDSSMADDDAGLNHNHNGDNTTSTDNAAAAPVIPTTTLRPSTREAIEMLPRSPETRTITTTALTRSHYSPPVAAAAAAAAVLSKSNDNDDNNYNKDNFEEQQQQEEGGITFLGLKNLLPADRFNEYVLGRSVKADVTAQKIDVPPSTTTTTTNNLTERQRQQQQQEEKKRKSHDYIHAMISNRHCRIYCLLNVPNSNNSNNKIRNSTHNNIYNSSNSHHHHHHPEMEVFVEDTSGNGTLINGTTLLRKNERRKLHTGDVICLLNPKLLYKKIRNGNERKRFIQQYSYVFVNLYEQERHWNYNYSSSQSLCGVGGGGGGGAGVDVGSPMSFSSSSCKKSQNSNSNGKGGGSGVAAVNPRATRCHSPSLGSRDDLVRRKVSGNHSRNTAGTATTTVAAATANGTTAIAVAAGVSRKSSLGSFLTEQSSTSRRRIEDEYDLRDLLGTGTCGEVRRAIHRRTGDERAVKIISITERGMGGANFFSKEKLSAIQAEAEILRSLNHPYVVKLFDVFVAPGKAIYLVMELIRGGDLFDRIVERERYTEVHARRLFRRILAAVHYLHEECGVVHRDLKPENILVVDRRSDVDIKLTDFGLAKNLTAEGLKTFCGTPQYFAPEVLRRHNTVMGNGRYGKEIDCWSIGVILFILLSGSPPFDVSAGFDAVASAKVVFYEDQWKHVSKEARDLVRSLLEKDAKKRMSVKDACEHPWVLVDDGDTHCHPLHDPVVNSNVSVAKPAEVKTPPEVKPPVETNEKEKIISDAQTLPAPPQPADMNKLAEEESPKLATKKRTRETFLSKSAPQLSKVQHKNNTNSTNDRNSSFLHGLVANKLLQQAMDVPGEQSPSSPLSKKLLFENPSNEDSVRKMSKQDVEQINTAGNTLPKPSLSAASRLLPKKKIQQQLGVNFKKVETTLPESGKTTSSSSDKENGNGEKRKQSLSTVTPPGQEQTLVFQLNKKRKTGKHNAAEETDDTGNAFSAPALKGELSEDELQSDFSDDEGDFKSKKSPAKKPNIEEFLYKKKSESIQSSASFLSPESKGTKLSTIRISLSPNLGDQEPASQKCEAKECASRANKDKLLVQKVKIKKKKQSFLFGKPPPSGLESTQERENESRSLLIDANDVTLGRDSNPLADERGEESIELERQPSSESMSGQASSSTKGKQKSIKNWFQLKK